MEEIDIKIEQLKEDIQEIENICWNLLRNGNVPEKNWQSVYNLLQKRMDRRKILDSLIDVKETIDSNRTTIN